MLSADSLMLRRPLAMLANNTLPLIVRHLLEHIALLRDIRGQIGRRLPVWSNVLMLLIVMDIQSRLRRKDIRRLTPVLNKLRL